MEFVQKIVKSLSIQKKGDNMYIKIKAQNKMVERIYQ